MEEEDMDMNIDMNDEEMTNVHEIDFKYEFDAAKFFDFTKLESEAQARVSELWFESAPDYPHSPFAVKLFQLKGLYSQNVDASPKSKYDAHVSFVNDAADINKHEQFCSQDKAYQAEKRSQVLQNVNPNSHDSQKQAGGLFGGQATGLSFYNHLANDKKKTKTKSLARPYMPRSSTLMKPTASQLAKQNQRQQAIDVSSHCGTESQASKRQKLEGDLLRKIVDMKQPTTLTHKIPKKAVAPQGMNLQSKLRITIPREPDLETAHRANRIRSRGNKEGETPTSTIGRFKARPLNKKILEASVCTVPKRSTPHAQDFQGLNKANPDSILENVNKDAKRCDSVDAPQLAEHQLAHSFKASPLDRKILTSRGELGVFRNSKRDVTASKESDFQRSKRNLDNPPVELFSKLSLAGEPQPNSCAPPQLPQRTCFLSKGSKENS